jgi:hypothetical protein
MAGGSNPQNVQTPQMAQGGMNTTQAAQPAAPATTPAAGQPNIYQQSSDAYTQALQGTTSAGAYQPQNVQATQVGTRFGYTPQNVQAGTASGGINTYMNPYTQQVIDTSMADLERQRQMQQNQLGQQASAAGAFGGSRQGIAEAETNRAFAQQGGQLAAQLRQQGFNTALGASQQDVSNQMQAALANQSAGANAAQFGQSTRLQAQGMNQSAGLQAALANQGAGFQAANLGLNAANQLGNLSQQGFNMGQSIGNQQWQQGLFQQGLNQQLINDIRNQYGGFTGSPAAGLGIYQSGLGSANMGQQTQTTTDNPGLFDYFSAAASALCWVAREVYGPEDDRWQQFRVWLVGAAPDWLFNAYAKHGEAFAGVVRKVPVLKRALRPLMDRARRAAGFEV